MSNIKPSDKKQMAIILERLSLAGSEIKGIGKFILIIILCALIFSSMIWSNLSSEPMKIEQVRNLIVIYWVVLILLVLIIASKFFEAGNALSKISEYYPYDHGNVTPTESDPTVYKGTD